MSKVSAVKKVVPITVEKIAGSLLTNLQKNRSEETVFAVVGYAGSGTSFVATSLKSFLTRSGFNPHIIKAKKALLDFAQHKDLPLPVPETTEIEKTVMFQEIGDQLRESSDNGIVAAYMIKQIQNIRQTNPDKKNVYILDSLKHHDEVDLLRHVYGKGFCLIGVGCRPDIRTKRLMLKFAITDESDVELNKFIHRDAEDSEKKHGQQVNNTFHKSDYFVDNTASNEAEKLFVLPDELKRVYDIMFTGKIQRARVNERGMFFAYSASLRSSCLSRQVGAAILDKDGQLLSVGTNEVPKYGGGAYDESSAEDNRCFKIGICSNTSYQLQIIEDIYKSLNQEDLLKADVSIEKLNNALKRTRVKSLIEFSRSVHAEMDALLSLVRAGTKLFPGTFLFSTTYPCHSCARHLVAAGISTVYYLEPYAKSLAIALHEDSIADNKSDDESKNRVRFIPYQGVSPRLYETIYLKSGDLKDKQGKVLTESIDPQKARAIWTKTYLEFENEVVNYISATVESTYGQEVEK